MIRKYEDRDLSELLEVWYQASLLAHPFLDEAFLSQERKKIATLHIPAAETWVFVSEGHLVGFISLFDNEVGAIFVAPAAQGRGIGRALMDHARSMHAELELEVFKANHIGRRFYDRYGFVYMSEGVHEETGQPVLRLRFGDG